MLSVEQEFGYGLSYLYFSHRSADLSEHDSLAGDGIGDSLLLLVTSELRLGVARKGPFEVRA